MKLLQSNPFGREVTGLAALVRLRSRIRSKWFMMPLKAREEPPERKGKEDLVGAGSSDSRRGACATEARTKQGKSRAESSQGSLFVLQAR
jgi:hypothetical protein